MKLLPVISAILLMPLTAVIALPNQPSSYTLTQQELEYYYPLSHAGALCKAICLGTATADQIFHSFNQLDYKDKCLVYEAVYLESGVVTNDLHWGEHHFFDDPYLFCLAYPKAFRLKFDRLSNEDKNKVYQSVYELSGVKTADTRWGERHVFDHLPRLIDAMAIALQ